MSEAWIKPVFEPGVVSVIVPSYNQEKLLPACFESLVNQEYRPLEIILIDDGSSDGTRQIMQEFKEAYDNGFSVKCIYQSNHGAPHARNQGCRASTGEFIQFLDSDDLLGQKKLSQQVRLLQENKEIDVVYGDGQYLVHMGDGPPREGRIISIGPSSDIVASLLYGYWVPSFSYLVRRSPINNCGPWDETLSSLQDMEYFIRLGLKGAAFCYKEGITGFYRKHSSTSISERAIPSKESIRQQILMSAAELLRRQGKLDDKRVAAIVECHRRIARHIYFTDRRSFEQSISEIERLIPCYLPQKKMARTVSQIIGFENYERLAAITFYVIYRNKKDWLKPIWG